MARESGRGDEKAYHGRARLTVGLPVFGIYSNILKKLLTELGVPFVMPHRVTPEMVRQGVANSSDMICYPYKVLLGQQIWALEQGATDLVMFSSCGTCRQKFYHELEDHTLRGLGYNFNMHVITRKNWKKVLKNLSGVSLFHAYRIWQKVSPAIKEIESRTYDINKGSPLKIGIVGEVYTMWEPDINFSIVKKLQAMGTNVHMSITVSDYLKKRVMKDSMAEKDARALISQDLGGHGIESIANTSWYARNGFDGVIHLLPLSCMPESTVEPLVDHISERYDIPVYRFPIDEATFEVGFNTRLETFISILRRRKKCI